jgi:hypothetical protein
LDGIAYPQDTTKVISEDVPARKILKEQVLASIKIEAVVEKPSVSIIPKRREPEFGEIEFIDRSFEHELKQGPKRLVILEEYLESAKKIKKLKKILAKKKK